MIAIFIWIVCIVIVCLLLLTFGIFLSIFRSRPDEVSDDVSELLSSFANVGAFGEYVREAQC